MDVYLDEHSNAVQPDLIVVLKENEGIIRPRGHIHGVPDLLIEVLSSDHAHDLVKKKEFYARFGVKEYFVVEPQTRLVMHFSLTGPGSYALVGQEIGVLHSGLLGADFRL